MILSDRYHYSSAFFDRCKERLDSALSHVPAYKKIREPDAGTAHTLEERYDDFPILDKAAIRRSFPLGLVPDTKNLEEGLESGEIEYTFSSGSTSEKVINVFDPDWWSRSEKASWKLNAVLAKLPYPQRTAKLASSLNVGINCEEDLPMDHRILGDTLYLNEKTSVLQWSKKHFRRMARELSEFQPVILEANPSLLARLAYWALDTGTPLYSPQAIVLTFELPSKISLAAIRRVFGSPLISSYGSTETGFVLEECEKGLLHQNTEFCRIDFSPVSAKFKMPDLGRIFVTTFDTPWNCIVRFDIGDLVRLHSGRTCPCGRQDGMVIERVEGRVSNITFTTKGGIVTPAMVDDKIAAFPEVRDYQLRQTSKKTYVMDVMLAKSSQKTVDDLFPALESLYGVDGMYAFREVDNLLPEPSGKFRRTQATFPFDEDNLFE